MWSKLYLAQDVILSVLKVNCPFKTGNLSKSINAENERLFITIGDDTVQYAPYTNESWDNFNPPLKGHTNPNEGWINRALEIALPIVDSLLQGSITEAEAEEIVHSNNAIWQAKLDKAAEKREAKARTL